MRNVINGEQKLSIFQPTAKALPTGNFSAFFSPYLLLQKSYRHEKTYTYIHIFINNLNVLISRRVCKYRRTILFRRLGISLDRKSTRLNSSRVKISYAVFCLIE